MEIKRDCKFFKGDIPCKPHKMLGVHCENCTKYSKIEHKIIIIKIGAIGDVIRTTCLLHKLRKEYNNAEIYWLSNSPEVLPASVDHRLKLNYLNITLLQQIEWDLIINLDKDKEACALLNSLEGKAKKGFMLNEGKTSPINEEAKHKYLTGLFDDVNKQNKKNYQQEIFEICGFIYNGEEYLIDVPDATVDWDIDYDKKVVGLNTGCGGRWTSRLWPEQYWTSLAKILLDNNYDVILLGGELEHEKNSRISKESGAKYFGYFELNSFVSLMNQCKLIVSAVTMAMHIAIGLKKNLLLFNNIFNPYEFELYNRGEIISPMEECKCFYKSICEEETHCMTQISPEYVFQRCLAWT